MASAQQPLDERCGRFADVFAVVEHEQLLTVAEPTRHGVAQVCTGLLVDADGPSQLPHHLRGIGHQSQLGQPHSVTGPGEYGLGGSQRETRLADPTHSGQSHQPTSAEQSHDLGQLLPAANEGGEFGRQVVPLARRSGSTYPGRSGPEDADIHSARQDHERRILAQYGAFEPDQFGARIDAKLVA